MPVLEFILGFKMFVMLELEKKSYIQIFIWGFTKFFLLFSFFSRGVISSCLILSQYLINNYWAFFWVYLTDEDLFVCVCVCFKELGAEKW